MDMMMNAAKKNLEILTEMQQRNEEMARVMLEHVTKTRQQIVATNESLMNLVGQQGKTAEAFVTDSVKTAREIVEQQVQEARKAVTVQ